MPKIQDYLLAECALFRTPPVDTSKVSQDIEKALMDAWKQGVPVTRAVDTLINNSQIVQKLVDQVAENLRFQREQAVNNVDEELQSKLSQYEQERKARLSMIEQEYGGEAKRKEETAQEKRQSFENKHRTFTASQQKLEELRARVASNLGEVNGKEGLTKLMEIKSCLQESKAEPTERAFYGREKRDGLYQQGKEQDERTQLDTKDKQDKNEALHCEYKGGIKLDKETLDSALELATKKKTYDFLEGKGIEQILEEERQKAAGQYAPKKKTVYSRVKDFFKSTYTRMNKFLTKKIF